MDEDERATIVGGGIEIVSLALQLYMMLLKQSGMTPEQQAEFETSERAKFLENRPENLPKPPGDELEEGTHS